MVARKSCTSPSLHSALHAPVSSPRPQCPHTTSLSSKKFCTEHTPENDNVSLVPEMFSCQQLQLSEEKLPGLCRCAVASPVVCSTPGSSLSSQRISDTESADTEYAVRIFDTERVERISDTQIVESCRISDAKNDERIPATVNAKGMWDTATGIGSAGGCVSITGGQNECSGRVPCTQLCHGSGRCEGAPRREREKPAVRRGRSPVRICLGEKLCRKTWSLFGLHRKWRVFSFLFCVLLATQASAHPLIARPGNSATLISRPVIHPRNFTPSTPPATSSAQETAERRSISDDSLSLNSVAIGDEKNDDDNAGAALHRIGDTDGYLTFKAGDGENDGSGSATPAGIEDTAELESQEGSDGKISAANGSATHRRIVDTAGGASAGNAISHIDDLETKNPKLSEIGNEILTHDVHLGKENGENPENVLEENESHWRGFGVPGVEEGDEDFDEAVRRPPTPLEAERIARFNSSGFRLSMLKDAVEQLVREVAQHRWSSSASLELDNSTSFSEALRRNLSTHQLNQLRNRDFSRLDFKALEEEIRSGLPSPRGAEGSPPLAGEREGRSFTSRLPRFFSNLGRMLDIETVINEVETSIMSSVSCNACKGGVGLLQHYIEQGNTKEDIVRAASKLCTNFRVETPRVCFGILHLMADEVMYVMENLVMQPDGICGFLIGDVCGVAPDPYHKWRVLFPPYPKPPIQLIKPPKEDTPTYKVLHLSDTHYDPYYLEGSNAECNEPMCCRATSGRPASDGAKAGKWGDYRKCDTPKRTLVSMYEHIARTHPDVDYIIWTGDLPPHDIWNQTKESNLHVLRETVQQLRTFFPGVPVFPALGNHESAPVNSFPPPSIPPQHSVQWLYDDLRTQWLQWLPPHTAPTIQKGGYYSVLVAPGFRIISLNMNFCNNKNWWLLLDSEDPADQLQWLVYELQAAELKGEKVHILGHIPPGYHDCLKVWSRNFYTVVNRFEQTITAQFYGHTHYDEFELFYDPFRRYRVTNVAFIAPSQTSYYRMNPGYRIYSVQGDFEGSQKRVVDLETWVMDLDVANDPRNSAVAPHWYRLYSAREAYEMRSLLPVDWDNLVYRMVEDQQLFDTFYRHYWKNSPKREPCDAECKKRLLCDLKSGRSNDRKKTCAVVHERVEAQERSQWRSWLYSGLTLTYVWVRRQLGLA